MKYNSEIHETNIIFRENANRCGIMNCNVYLLKAHEFIIMCTVLESRYLCQTMSAYGKLTYLINIPVEKILSRRRLGPD